MLDRILLSLTLIAPIGVANAIPVIALPPGKTPVFSADGIKAYDKARCGPEKKTAAESDSNAQGSGFSRSLGPLTLSVGPTDKGGLGASLKGGDSLDFEILNKCSPSPADGGYVMKPVGRVTYDLDASASSRSDALNASSLTIRPMLSMNFLFAPVRPGGPVTFLPVPAGEKDTPPTGADILAAGPAPFVFSRPVAALSIFGELRQRYGEVDAGAQGVIRANQFIYGGGLEAAWTGAYRFGSGSPSPSALYGLFRDPPRIRVGYYSATDVNDNMAPVPEDLMADYLTVGGDLHIALPWFTAPLYKSPLLLNYEYKGSKPTTGDSGYSSYHNLQLAYVLKGDLKPVVTYKTGKEQGLDYDKQVILGILIELTKPQ